MHPPWLQTLMFTNLQKNVECVHGIIDSIQVIFISWIPMTVSWAHEILIVERPPYPTLTSLHRPEEFSELEPRRQPKSVVTEGSLIWWICLNMCIDFPLFIQFFVQLICPSENQTTIIVLRNYEGTSNLENWSVWMKNNRLHCAWTTPRVLQVKRTWSETLPSDSQFLSYVEPCWCSELKLLFIGYVTLLFFV